MNLYTYVPNSLTWIDPLGLKCTLSGNKIKRVDGSELITIPGNAKVRKVTPPKGHTGDYGYEYKWKNADGGTTTVRIHRIDPSAPPGYNASKGWVVRILDGKKSMDASGTYNPPGVFNPSSPHYNSKTSNDVHIPIEQPTRFPGVN